MKIAKYILYGLASVSFLACGIWLTIILFGGFVAFAGFAEVPPHWASKAIWCAICGAGAFFVARHITSPVSRS